MQAHGRRLLLRDTSRTASHVFARQASLTSAINRGIRKTQRGVETAFEGVRHKRSYDDNERAPWQVKTERGLRVKAGSARGWQGDDGRHDREQRRSSGNRGGGFSRENADRRVRYQERKDGIRERGPPPNRDEPTRAERRRAMFGEPYSGQPSHDRDFMENHTTKDRDMNRRSPAVLARGGRSNTRYGEGGEPEHDFDDEYNSSQGGWTAEDVEKEWEGRKPQFQPEFTRARDMQRMKRGGRLDRTQNWDDRNDRRNAPTRQGRDEHFSYSERNGREAPIYKQQDREYGIEDPEEDYELPTLEQRRNKFRPPRKLERSLVDVEATSKISTTAPASVQFTTAASTFIYGTFAVQEAIRAGRRTLYTLYIFRGQSIEAPTTPESYHLISKLALSRGCKVKEISGEGWSRLLNKMTASRPHNGWVLEASEIPKLPVTSFNPMESPSDSFEVTLGHQSAEDLAVNAPVMQYGSSPNSGSALLTSLGGTKRYPLILLLDRIMDPGNLGAIVRSAHFLGVDALMVLEHSTAPFNAIMLKVAAGAAEYLPILMVKNEHDLVKNSKRNGWKFFAAVSPDSVSGSGIANQKNSDISSALSQGPCVLMLGSEGEGLRPHLQKQADGVALITNARGVNAGVDSLNVSVASALLCQEFLRGPHNAVNAHVETSEDSDLIDNASINEKIIELVGADADQGDGGSTGGQGLLSLTNSFLYTSIWCSA